MNVEGRRGKAQGAVVSVMSTWPLFSLTAMRGRNRFLLEESFLQCEEGGLKRLDILVAE